MKKSITIFLAIMMVISLAACSSNEKSSSKKKNSDVEVVSEVEGTVRVALAGWQLEDGIDAITGVENEGLNTYLDREFYPRYPNIKLEVTTIPWENVQAKQTALLSSGDADILYTGGAFAAQFNQKGLLRDISDLIESDANFDPSIYLQGIWENSYSTKSYDKKAQIGIPAILGRRVTVYDKKLFDQWGVDYLSDNPTPEEILEKAKQMTGKNPETGKQNYGLFWSGNSLNASTIVALTHAYGAVGAEGSLADPANIKWKLNSPEMVKVFEWIEAAAPLAPAAFVNGQGAENFGLENNDIAIALDSSGGTVMGQVKAGGSEDLIDRYPAALNLGPNGEGWVAVDPFVMAKDTKNVEASWEVMKFFTSYETQKWGYENFTYTPTLANADFVAEDDIYIKKAAEVAAVSKSTLMDEANPFFSAELTPAFNGFISKAHNGDAPDIQKFLDDLQKRAEDWSARQ